MNDLTSIPGPDGDAATFDTLAQADRPDRSFLRARWFLSGPQPATTMAIARDPSGKPIAGFALRPKNIGPTALGLDVN